MVLFSLVRSFQGRLVEQCKVQISKHCIEKGERDYPMPQPPFSTFPQGQGQGYQVGIIVRHYYDVWPLIHLVSLGLWLALFLLLICGIICRICRKKMRMCGWRGSGCCQGPRHGPDHGHCGCRGRSHDHPVPPFHHLDAVEILRQRYASGEIDDATFEHMRERLGPSVGPERPSEG
jgi:hypothetical protein